MKKKKAAMTENILILLMNIVFMCAFLLIIIASFKSINDKMMARQVMREYMLLMETEGYLKSGDEANLKNDLQQVGLTSIDLSGTTRAKVSYGSRIYLKVRATYKNQALNLTGGISKLMDKPSVVSLALESTAKQ